MVYPIPARDRLWFALLIVALVASCVVFPAEWAQPLRGMVP